MAENWLIAFANESNRIEGMPSATKDEIAALETFVVLERPQVSDLEAYVSAVAPRHVLRRLPTMNVRVGNHVAPRGGPEIEKQLAVYLIKLPRFTPHENHLWYETLHPFTDGNGRSGRALWLWQVRYEDGSLLARVKALGFLHSFYYDTLAAFRHEEKRG